MSQITISDVARAAGVSVSTVSRILNNKTDVANSTRERVLNVIEQMGYRPHAQAQRLRAVAGRSHTISLLYPVEHSAFDPVENAAVMFDFILGISRAVEEEGYQLNLITTPITETRLLNLYRSSLVGGTILMKVYQDDWRVQVLRETPFPFVMIGRTTDNTGLHYVDLNYEQAVTVAFQHLIELRHTKIGFIFFPSILQQKQYGPARYADKGFQQMLEDNQLDIAYQQPDIDMSSILQATHALLDEQPDTTAIVSVHGEYIIGMIEALKQRALRIPDDISVVIIANQQQSEKVFPALTRVDLPSEDEGYLSAKMLIQQIEKLPIENPQILVQPELIECGSTRALS